MRACKSTYSIFAFTLFLGDQALNKQAAVIGIEVFPCYAGYVCLLMMFLHEKSLKGSFCHLITVWLSYALDNTSVTSCAQGKMAYLRTSTLFCGAFRRWLDRIRAALKAAKEQQMLREVLEARDSVRQSTDPSQRYSYVGGSIFFDALGKMISGFFVFVLGCCLSYHLCSTTLMLGLIFAPAMLTLYADLCISVL